MRCTATIILMLFSFELIHAQDIDTIHPDKSHIFSFCTGYVKYIERDEAMSPFIYRGHSCPIELSYQYSGLKNHHEFYANFDKSKLNSSIPDYENAGISHYVKSTDIQLGYSYLRKAFSLPEFRSNLYFGGEFSSLLNLRQHAYIDNNEFLMLDQFNSLGFKAQLDKRFANKKRVVFLSINIPVVSYVLMGNTYNSYVGEKTDPLINYIGNVLFYLAKNGDFVSFNKLVYFKTDFSFIQFIGNHIGVECRYSLRYYKYSQFQNINYSKNLQSQFLIGIIGKL
jgi:hypothetical protein